MVEDQTGHSPQTKLYGPGYHVLNSYHKVLGIYSLADHPGGLMQSPVGDLTIAIVDQGTVMHFELGGQNILLGPGLHLILDPLEFKKTISLDSFYIEIGPEKWVTIPDGYDGIAVNLGRMRVLDGGKQHHLAHVGDKFVKMVPKTLITDRVPTDIPGYIEKLLSNNLSSRSSTDQTEYLRTTTSEGSTVVLDAMVFWRIEDTDRAARNAMEILVVEDNHWDANKHTAEAHIRAASHNITQLRQTVLRIVKNHLTAAVGSISLAGNSALSSAVQDKKSGEEDAELKKLASATNQQRQFRNAMVTTNLDTVSQSFEMLKYLQERQNPIAVSCNAELAAIGVRVDTICIYSVMPSQEIQQELNRQTKARVDANTIRIEANAKKQAIEIETEMENHRLLRETEVRAQTEKIKAEAVADASLLKARAEAEAIKTIAKARKQEAEELESGAIATELARIRAAGEAGELIFKGSSNKFVFGNNPGDILYSLLDKMGNPQGALRR